MITIDNIEEIKEQKKMGRPRKEGFDKSKYKMQFHKENYKRYALECNHKYDADIIEHLEKQEKKQTYIKAVIRSDMNANKIK